MLLKTDDRLSDLHRACEQLDLQIEILKTDIENIDFIICNELRMKFIQETRIPV